jgi:tetratricopeptide (TPR) repeat protein
MYRGGMYPQLKKFIKPSLHKFSNMIRTSLVVLIVLTLAATSFAQNLHRIDSLRGLIPQKHNTELFDLLNDIAWEYRVITPDSTIQYAQRAFALGRKLGFKKKMAKPLNYIGVAHEYKGEAIEAYDAYRQALMVANSQNDELEVAYANNNSGRLFFDQGNINRSLEHFNTALRIFEHKNDSTGIAYVYLSLAHLYQFERNYKSAEEYFKKVYNIRLHVTGMPNVAALLQLGTFYRDANQLQKSTRCYLQADSLCLQRKDYVTRSSVSIQLAENYFMQGNMFKAGELTDQCFQYANEYNLTNDLSLIWLLKGKIYFKMNELEKAKNNFLKVTSAQRPGKDIMLKMDAHYYLGQIYSRQGQMEEELRNKINISCFAIP